MARINKDMDDMIRSLGIDPGTGSWDILGMEGEEDIFLDISIPSKKIVATPTILLDIIERNKPLDSIVAPSGHGVPLKLIAEMSDDDLRKANLRREKEGAIMGIGKVMELLKARGVKGHVVPGVKQLATVKNAYKYNKIDMGTADKVCAAAAAINDQSKQFGIPWEKTSFILAEIGTAFTAVLAVENGQIIDGIGGTCGAMGFMAAGGLDAELAYLLDHVSKKVIYSGGVNQIAGYPNMSPREVLLMAKKDKRIREAVDGFFHDLVKDIAGIMPSFSSPRKVKEVLVSSKVVNGIMDRLKEEMDLHARLSVRQVGSFARISKIATQGAVLIANGLAGGKYTGLVETMKLHDSNLDLLANIHVGSLQF